MRGNSVFRNKNGEIALAAIFDTSIDESWEFYKDLFKDENDLVWPTSPYDGDAEEFIMTLEEAISLDTEMMLEDFEGSIEVI